MARRLHKTKYVWFSKQNSIVSLLTGDFGRAKTPTTATVKASYFPLIIIESVGI